MVTWDASGVVTGLLRRLSLPLVVAAQIVLAAFSLNRIYSGLLLVGLVTGVAIGSVLVSVLLRRIPAALVAAVSVLAMLLFTGYAISVSAHAAGLSGDLSTLAIDAARNAVPRLLTALIPVEPQPDTVLAPVVLAWLAGFAGAELATRARRPALALLPPTLLYVSALVLVGPNADVAIWQPVLFASLAALGLVAGSASSGARRLSGITNRDKAVLRVRTASGLAVGVTAILAVVVVVSPIVAGRVGLTPGDPRRYVQPPNLDVLDQNPLIRLSGWASTPEQPLFRVEILRGVPPTPSPTPTPSPSASVDPFAPDVPPPAATSIDDGNYDTRLRLAVLPDWDGVTWHMNADYRNAGRVLPRAPDPPGFGQSTSINPHRPLTIEERITVEELSGRLLPAVAAPQRIDGIRVAYDQSNGALLNGDRLTPGVAYTVTSLNPSVDDNMLMAANVPDGDDVARYLEVGPAVPRDLSQFAQTITQGESSPYLRALALQAFMAEHYRFAVDAPSGHSYPNLSFFLLADTRLGGQRGTSEQFATAFATLGRLLGLPTRVVVGFHTPTGGGMVTGKDAVAWPEVLFAGIGWVPFDPMPPANGSSRPVEPEFLPPPPPTTTPPPSVTPPADPTYEPAPTGAPVAASTVPGIGATAIASGIGGGLLGVAMLAVLAVVLLRILQTRRRLHSGDPPRQVVGAWDEVIDTLVLAGRPPPKHLAAAEIADYAALVAADGPGRLHTRRPRPVAPPLDDLATSVNAVAFAGHSGPGPDATTAERVQQGAIAFKRAVYARRPWWRRLLWRVDPRPLRRRA
jgi:transglutaminase-like putative cysteine protease